MKPTLYVIRAHGQIQDCSDCLTEYGRPTHILKSIFPVLLDIVPARLFIAAPAGIDKHRQVKEKGNRRQGPGPTSVLNTALTFVNSMPSEPHKSCMVN